MESAELCGVSTLPGGGCHWAVGARAAVMGRVMILSDPRGSALVVLTAQCSFASASPSVTRSASGTCCSYMVFCSSQIWFLSPLKYFFQPFMFSYSLLVDLKAYCVFFHCSFCSSQDTSLIVFVFPY